MDERGSAERKRDGGGQNEKAYEDVTALPATATRQNRERGGEQGRDTQRKREVERRLAVLWILSPVVNRSPIGLKRKT